MTRWTPRYTDQERRAIEYAYCDLRIRPAADIPRMAADGELRPGPGEDPLPSFDPPASTVITIGKAAERRRAGRGLRPDIAKMAPRDRAHALQLRLTGLIDQELLRLELERAKHPRTPLDAEQLRKIGRALRELATLPDPSEPRLPRSPGLRDADGTKPDGPTTDSLAGRLLAAADAATSPTTRDHVDGSRSS